jgi:hypothetical protein
MRTIDHKAPCFVVRWLLLASVAGLWTPSVIAQVLQPPDPNKAIVVYYTNKWEPLIQRYGASTGNIDGDWIALYSSGSGNDRGESLSYKSDRANPEVQTRLGLKPRRRERSPTGYRYLEVSAGDYIMTGAFQPNSNGTGNWIDIVCRADSPVFHFEGGTVNVLEPLDLLNKRAKNPAERSQKIEDQIKFAYEERGDFDVRLAPIVGSVTLSPPTTDRQRFVTLYISPRVQYGSVCPTTGPVPLQIVQ